VFVLFLVPAARLIELYLLFGVDNYGLRLAALELLNEIPQFLQN
jgi:hypothetical protein